MFGIATRSTNIMLEVSVPITQRMFGVSAISTRRRSHSRLLRVFHAANYWPWTRGRRIRV